MLSASSRVLPSPLPTGARRERAGAPLAGSSWLKSISGLLVACLILGSAHTAAAEPSPTPDPRWSPPVCTSFDPQSKRYGPYGEPEYRAVDGCPQGSVFIAEMILSSRETKAFQTTALKGNCCALPPDALTPARHLFAGKCPDGSVVTGARGFSAVANELRNDQVPTYLLECTFINTKRYQLGTPNFAVRVSTTPQGAGRPGLQEVFGLSPHVSTSWNRIPAGIRFAIGRVGRHGREAVYCAGYPWGSLLVGRGAHSTCGFIHRELQYRGEPGDPVQGYPVSMFPECDAIGDPFSENPRCIRATPESSPVPPAPEG